MSYKLPVSVLVVIHTPALEVLVLERTARPGWWQSVTGSIESAAELLDGAAAREVAEETGIDAGSGRLERWNVVYTFEIFGLWRSRFAPGVRYNVEHAFGLELPERCAVRLAANEHLAFAWLPWREAAARCFSWSNRDAIGLLGENAAAPSPSIAK